MTREELKRLLSAAGSKFDGHVTNGSIEEQMKVLDPILELARIHSIYCLAQNFKIEGKS